MRFIGIIIELFTKFKFEISRPTSKEVLIFDGTNTNLIKKYLKNKYVILYTRNEKFNLFILLQNFFRGKFKKLEYLETYIRYVNPKVILTTIDNNPLFYELKTRADQKKILLQTAWKYPVFDYNIFKENKEKVIKKNNFNLDTAFVFNKHIGKLFNKLNAKKFITIGSLRSNYFKINKSKKIDLLFISCWGNVNLSHKVNNNLSFGEFFDKQIDVLRHLSNYAKKHDLNLHILGKRSEHQLEYNFYHDILKNKIKWKFLKHGKYNPYKIIDSSKIVCNLYSTLGYESFSRGNKTIFFNPYKKTLKSLTFGWPFKNFKSEGPFWTKKIDYNNIEKIINSVRLMNKNKFTNLKKKYINNLMIYDAKNSQLKKILSNFCLQVFLCNLINNFI